jgi:hypothetical protein
MASLSITTDATKPLDTSNWTNCDQNSKVMTTEQKESTKAIGNRDFNLARSVPADSDMELEDALQESMPWTKVTNKKDSRDVPNEKMDTAMDSTMKKVRVTLSIRIPPDTSNFSPAKLHIDTLHEIHKFDESLIVFNADGNTKINIESPISETRYKETFHPIEKRTGRGPSSISISHDIFLTAKANDCKEAIFPFLKKNRIFMYLNPKPGLEHFSAIGVLFGPNPDFTWRDELSDLLIDTMKSEINEEEAQKIGVTDDGKPKIILSLNIQTIGINQPTPTTSVALEIRVPSGLERVYTSIIERVYEKAEISEIVIPTKLGKFFPYYLKSKMAETFNFLMRQQNAEMTATTIIPIFGYTPAARQQQITIDGEITTVELALATTPNIIRIEATPSTWNLYKYLVVVKTSDKATVQQTIKKLFAQIKNPLENQPPNFPKPRCGGRETSSESDQNQQMDMTRTAYMASLETITLAQNPQDAGPAEPPKRQRKITISYAGAAKAGILKPTQLHNKNNNNYQLNDNEIQTITTTQDSFQTPSHRQVSWDENLAGTSRSLGSSLSRSITNSKITNFKLEIETEIQELKTTMSNRLARQDQHLHEIKNSINNLTQDFESRMAVAVIEALMREKDKVQELTLGKTYGPDHAPLADEHGLLPGGVKA